MTICDALRSHHLILTLLFYFSDGIYVLLRPDKSKPTKKKKKKSDLQEQYERPKIPPHLAHLKMETALSKNCTWSLSGPQFPKPTAIQQRYCYPQGNDAYASKKGGSMWTMYNREGKEDDEYRLLHVYYSIKRANNMSSFSANSKASSISSKSKNKKQTKRKKATVGIGKGTKKQKRSISKSGRYSMLPGELPPSSPCKMKNQIFRQPHMHISPNTASTSSGGIHSDLSIYGSFGGSFEGHKIYTVPSILYNDEYQNQTLRYHTSDTDSPESDNTQESQVQPPPDLAREFDNMLGVPLADPSLMMKEPGVEWTTLTGAVDTNHTFPCHRQINESFPEVLMQKLSVVHNKIIHEWIGCRPRSERGRLVSVVANWARSISRSPLEILIPGEGDNEQRDFVSQSDGKNVSLKMEDWDMAVAV
jgi:hypothetical protein